MRASGEYCLTDLGWERFGPSVIVRQGEKPVKYRNSVEGVDVETEVTPKEVVGAHEIARALMDDAFVRGLEFRKDNFEARRASQRGAGVAYDPESLLTGEEIEAGLDYDCPRVWRFAGHREAAVWGEIAVGDIPRLAPRVRKANPENPWRFGW